MAAIPSLGAAAFAGGGASTQGALNLQRPYPLDGPGAAHRVRRRLQAEECEGDFTVNTPLWPDSTGCYTEAGASRYEFTVGANTYVVGSIPKYNSADSPSVWIAGLLTAVDAASGGASIDPHCHSEGDTTVHAHPADVEFWLCDIDNTGTAYTEMSADQFGTSCGCAAGAGEDPAAATTAPVAPEAPTTPAPEDGTRDLGTLAPAAAEAAPTPAAVVTTTPAPVAAEAAPTPVVVTATPAPAAAVVTATPAPVAAEAAPTPAAVAETLAPALEFSIGGEEEEGEEEEEEEEVPPETSAAISSDTPNGLCGEVQSLLVTTSAEQLVDLEGCFEETGHEHNEAGGHFFSITGSNLRGQMAVFPGYIDAESTDARWFIGFVAVSAADTLVYCVSAQPPSAGHPSTADWYCDDGTGNFPLTTDDEFNVLCGCSSDSASAPAEEEEDEEEEEEVEDTADVVEATTTPADGGATEPPAHDSPTSHESATSDHDGATHSPVLGATEAPSATPAVGVPTMAPAQSGLDLVGGSSAPVAAVAATESPVVDEHGTSASDHGGSDHDTSTGDEEDHATSAHDGTDGDHSGTPSPTTVARGIIGASPTPAPSAEGFEAAAVSGAAALSPTAHASAGVWGCWLGVAAAARAVLAVGAAGLFAAAA